jgi:hypothetical protein
MASKPGGSSKKIGRNKRKAAARGCALSRYVRGTITFETYAKQTGVKFNSNR